MAPHSSILAWKIPWTEEPGRLKCMGSLRVRHNWETSLSLFTFMHWRRKWQPTPVFLPRESQARGSLAAIYGVAQSRTRLKWLSSSSIDYYGATITGKWLLILILSGVGKSNVLMWNEIKCFRGWWCWKFWAGEGYLRCGKDTIILITHTQDTHFNWLFFLPRLGNRYLQPRQLLPSIWKIKAICQVYDRDYSIALSAWNISQPNNEY